MVPMKGLVEASTENLEVFRVRLDSSLDSNAAASMVVKSVMCEKLWTAEKKGGLLSFSKLQPIRCS